MKTAAVLITVFVLAVQSTSLLASFEPRKLIDNEVKIPEDEIIETDLMVTAGNVIIEGDVTGTVIVTGGNVLISGDIGESLKVFGGNIRVTGAVGEGLEAYGVNVELTGHVEGTLQVAGIKLVLDGVFDDDAIVRGGKVDINGTFKKNVELYAYEATMGEATVIQGDLEYSVEKKLTQEKEAEVAGESKDVTERTKQDLRGVRYIFMVYLFLSYMVTGLILQAFSPDYLRRVSSNMTIGFPQCILAGFLALVGVPFAIFLMVITGVGLPCAIVILLIYMIVLYLSLIFAGIFVGKLIIGAVTNKEKLSLMLCMSTGLIVIILLMAVPRIGPFAVMLLAISGLGGFLVSLFKKEPPTVVVISPEGGQKPDETNESTYE